LRIVLFWVITQQVVVISCNFLQEITTAKEWSSQPLKGRSLKSPKQRFVNSLNPHNQKSLIYFNKICAMKHSYSFIFIHIPLYPTDMEQVIIWYNAVYKYLSSHTLIQNNKDKDKT
jgi:hypothetical protein